MHICLFISMCLVLAVTESKQCETAHSALTVDGVTYLVTDQRIVQIKDDVEYHGELNIPINLEGQTAAFGVADRQQYTLITGQGSHIYDDDGTAAIESSFHLPVNCPTKIDAATVRENKIFLFIGDKYQTYDMTLSEYSELRDLSNIGLPNNVDAAWHNPSLAATIVLKGKDIYLADDGDQTNAFFGELPFDIFFTVADLELCPST